MPTVSMANFEGEDLLSNRLLSFMANGDQSPMNSETLYHLAGQTSDFLSSSTLCSTLSDFNTGSPIHRNVQEKMSGGISLNGENGTYVNNNNNNNVIGPNPGTRNGRPMSRSCTPPPSTMCGGDFLAQQRSNQVGAPPYSALTSPCLSNKLTSIPQHSLINLNNSASTCMAGDRFSLQNSPFYNHYPANLQTQLQRQFPGISPGPAGALFPNGVTTGSHNFINRNGLYQDAAFSLPGFRSNNSTSGCCPQRELFPSIPSPHSTSASSGPNFVGPGLLMQDRLYYYGIAQRHGFIVGNELERIKENSRRSTSQSYGRISAYFRNRYGETETKTKAAYLQLGVRVPSKDHVSEIVGKGGQKIKLIREETGALITTPGEQEEHVFIIEAPPDIAMRVAHHLTARAQEITQSKLVANDRRRGSTSSQPSFGDASSAICTSSAGGSLTPGGSSGAGGTYLNGGSYTAASGVSGLLSMGNSANNSPLHPSVIASGFTSSSLSNLNGNNLSFNSNLAGGSHLNTAATSTVSGSFTSTVCATPNGSTVRSPNVMNSAFSSLSASPGSGQSNMNGLSFNSSNGASNSYGPNGSGTQNSITGSRVLLARGRISVPQEMVGKIIGTQGSIITTIQKDTGTEIKSPPKEAARGPNATSEFEISAYQSVGLNSNQAAECRVQQAKQLIGHLVMRQLERKASEEIEENSTSSNGAAAGSLDDQQRCFSINGNMPMSSSSSSSSANSVVGAAKSGIGSSCGHNGAANNLNGNSSGGSANGGNVTVNSNYNTNWMWPDVVQMDWHEAREVLDRILAESKNKTRRAKELAAGQSPVLTTATTCASGSNALLNSNSSQNFGSDSHSHHHHHHHLQAPNGAHFQSHLLSVGNFYDPNGSHPTDELYMEHGVNDNGTAPGLTQLSMHAGNGSMGTNGNQFGQHGGGTPVNEGGQEGSYHPFCSPRGMHNYLDLSNTTDRHLFPRAPGCTYVSDLWSSSSGFHPSDGPQSSDQQHTNGSNGSMTTTLNSLFFGHQLNSSGTTSNQDSHLKNGSMSPNRLVPNTGLDNDLLESNTMVVPLSSSSSIFQFNDDALVDSKCSNDLMNSTRLNRIMMNHPPLSQELQPLTRRHSDWIVLSNSFDTPIDDFPLASNTDIKQLPTLRNSNQDYPCPSFNLIQALDQLYLNNGNNNRSVGSGKNGSTDVMPIAESKNGGAVCPPGFELQDILSASQQQSIFANHDSGQDVWSSMNNDSLTTNDTNGASLFKHLFNSHANGTGGNDLLSSDLVVDNESLMVRHLHNSIWSQSAIPESTTAGVHTSPSASAALQIANDSLSDKTDASASNCLQYQKANYLLAAGEVNGSSSTLIINGRCGAIGEGRRRPRGSSPHLMQQAADNISMRVSSPLSASITEVA